MKYIWKIQSEPDIMFTYAFFNDKFHCGKLFKSAKTQYALTIGDHCIEFYPKLSYLNFKKAFNIKRKSIYLSVYCGRYHFKFDPDIERIEKNRFFYETHKI